MNKCPTRSTPASFGDPPGFRLLAVIGRATAPLDFAAALLVLCAVGRCSGADAGEEVAKPTAQASQSSGKVYGEWRIQIKPDKGPDYDKLIESEGLPLFRAAGGRMVGWWKTLVGNLYEHVTIWEYDDMGAFEKAIGFLGPNPQFAKFVAQRDPLLTGEENRFMRLSAEAIPPALYDPAKFVIHVVHKVPLVKQGPLLYYLESEGLKLMQSYGFRPVGPWTTTIGKWSEVTLLLRFESLAEREKQLVRFQASEEGRRYFRQIGELTEDITTRLLLPASFAVPPANVKAKATASIDNSALLPHLERLSSRVIAAGFADKFRSANCGLVETEKGTTLVDLPRGVDIVPFVKEVERLTGRKPTQLLLTHADPADLAAVTQLAEAGVKEIVVTRGIRDRLSAATDSPAARAMRLRESVTEVGDVHTSLRYLPADGSAASGCAVVELPGERVVFAGPLVVNGPRAALAGSETAEWIARLRTLEGLPCDRVVPGFGSWSSREAIVRQRRFLEELRSQVAYAVALGKPPESLERHVRISPDFQVWMPYDNPVADDLLYVYRELTVPVAPFNGQEPATDDKTPHALVVIGDGPHEPQHLERGLRSAFEVAGVVPHFAVDIRALTPENLARIKLLVMLRDGLMRPTDDPKSFYSWMTKDHERMIVEFVEKGGGFLNLHNALGLYPDDGPYLRLAAGRYIGHGPLERFRIEPAEREHPITRGIAPYFVADEQHTPVVDRPRVKLLFRSVSDGGVEGAAGWVYEPGAGRLCHLANGHTREALSHPTYQRVLRNAILWCVKRESPAP